MRYINLRLTYLLTYALNVWLIITFVQAAAVKRSKSTVKVSYNIILLRYVEVCSKSWRAASLGLPHHLHAQTVNWKKDKTKLRSK